MIACPVPLVTDVLSHLRYSRGSGVLSSWGSPIETERPQFRYAEMQPRRRQDKTPTCDRTFRRKVPQPFCDCRKDFGHRGDIAARKDVLLDPDPWGTRWITCADRMYQWPHHQPIGQKWGQNRCDNAVFPRGQTCRQTRPDHSVQFHADSHEDGMSPCCKTDVGRFSFGGEKLFLGKSQARYGYVLGACEKPGHPAPAATNIPNPLSRLQEKFGCNMLFLLSLGLLHLILRRGKVGAGILSIGIKKTVRTTDLQDHSGAQHCAERNAPD